MTIIKTQRKIQVGRVWYEAPPVYELRDILIRGNRLYGDRVAVRWRVRPQDKTVQERTYREFSRDVVAVQSWLAERLPKGSRIALVGENSYLWMVVWLAVASGFGVIVPIDRLLSMHEVKAILRRSNAPMLIYDAAWHEKIGDLMEDAPGLEWRAGMDRGLMKDEQRQSLRDEIAIDPKLFLLDDVLFCEKSAFSPTGSPVSEAPMNASSSNAALPNEEALVTLGSLLSQETPSSQEVPATVNPSESAPREGTVSSYGESEEDYGLLPLASVEDDAAILFTSGTSDTSKAVILTNKSIAADLRALLGSVSFPDPLQTLSILPLHHAFENTCGFLTVMTLGGTIHHNDGLRYIGRNLCEYNVQLTVAVPASLDAMKRKILREAEKQGRLRKLKIGLALSTLLYNLGIDKRRAIFRDVLDQLGGQFKYVICGAAPVSRDTLYFFRAIGVEVLAGYGLTEASPVVGGGNTMVNRYGTTGEPLAGVEVAIDDDGSGTGEILVSSDIVMKGYLDDPEATAEAIDEDGWLHTADVGRWTRHGSLKITGRSKSMIVLASGKKVFPEEIEALLSQDALIRDALVFGHKSASGDIVVTAKLVLDRQVLQDLLQREPTEDDYSNAVEALIAKVNRTLPSFKVIRSYFYSFQDMVKTTTLKVRRHIEMSRLDEFIRNSKATWQQLRGKNIDLMMEHQQGKK